MKLLILSDLHLEFQHQESLWKPSNKAIEASDVVILAGDIHCNQKAVDWVKDTFPSDKPVLYVLGNHDYYGSTLETEIVKMKERKDALEVNNLSILNNESIVIQGVKFIGCTLWTDYRLTKQYVISKLDARLILNDFRYIKKNDNHELLPEDLEEEHYKSIEFIREELMSSTQDKLVVISHHAPSERSINRKYLVNPRYETSASFASNLEHLVKEVDLWIHGHVHESVDYRVGEDGMSEDSRSEVESVRQFEKVGEVDTNDAQIYSSVVRKGRVITNPRGYSPYGLNPEFDECLVVEI